MSSRVRHALSLCRSLRCYSTSPSDKPSLKLVAELRKLTTVSISKARDALAASENNVDAALKWLENDLVISGAHKAAKVQDRLAAEGLVAVSLLSQGTGTRSGVGSGGVRAAIVELNCETDFVGRNELFAKLAADIAHTAAFISEPDNSSAIFTPCPLELLNDAPLLSSSDLHGVPSSTVGSSIRDLIAKVGEKISLRRAATVAQKPPLVRPELGLRLTSYLHGSVNSPYQGRIGTLAMLALKAPRLPSLLGSDAFLTELSRLERALARQIVGFDTRSITSPDGTDGQTALYHQPFMMFAGEQSGQPVALVLRSWAREHGLNEDDADDDALAVVDFVKWTVGEPIEASRTSP